MLDAKIKSLFMPNKEVHKVHLNEKIHRKNISNLIAKPFKSRNTVSKTQKDTICESKNKCKRVQHKVSNERAEQRGGGRERGANVYGGSKERNGRDGGKARNGRLSLMGVSTYSRNGVRVRSQLKEFSVLRHRLNRGLRKTYVESLLQPSYSMKNN